MRKARRFFEEVILNYEGSQCLTWPFFRMANGYGQMTMNGRRAQVHRAVCERVHGPPPTPKHEASHSCGKGSAGCVNPRHLSWKTHRENEADKRLHGTNPVGARHGRAKLTEEQAREILLLKGLEDQKSVAQRYGVSVPAISLLQAGKTWSHLHTEEPTNAV